METKKFNSRYIAVIIAAGMLCFVMAFRQSCVSVFVASVSEKFSASTTAVMTFISIFNIAALITTAMWGKWCNKYGLVKCVALSGILVALAMAGWAISPNLIVFYLFSAVAGVFHAGCGVLPASIAVTQWFEEKHGTIMGIVVTFLSIGGVLGNIVFPRIIVSSGWETAMVCMAAATLIGTVPFAFLLKSPAECGMMAYGHKESPESGTAASAADLPGIPASRALKMPLFYILWVGMLFACIPSAWMNNLPTWALQNGMDVAQSGMLLSFVALGGIVTTLLIGISNDKLGSEKTTVIFLGFGAVALLGYIAAKAYGMALTVSLLFAIGLAFMATMPQIITAQVFGPKDYSQLNSIVLLTQSVAGIIGPPAISFAHETSGTYTPVLIALAVIWVFAIVLVNYALKKGKTLLTN